MEKGNCKRCGRALTSQTSIDRGYGSHCYQKVEEARREEKEEDKEELE